MPALSLSRRRLLPGLFAPLLRSRAFGVAPPRVFSPGVFSPVGSLARDRGGGFLDVSRVPPRDVLRFFDPSRCGVCHDHGLVLTGTLHQALARGATLPDDAPNVANVGIACLSCRGATEVRNMRGNGVLALALPDDPVVTEDDLLLGRARLYTRLFPSAHKRRMLDEKGQEVLEHLTERLYTPLRRHVLLPGYGHIVRYRFVVPEGAKGPLRLEARLLLESLAEALPEDVEVLRVLPLTRCRAGSLDEAIEAARALLQQRPDDFEALRFLSAVFAERGDAETAARHREKAEAVRSARDATLVAWRRQLRDPIAAREADRAHVHVLVEVQP